MSLGERKVSECEERREESWLLVKLCGEGGESESE